MADAVLLEASTVEPVRQPLGLAAAQRGARDGVLQRDDLPEQPRRQLAGAGGEVEAVTIQELDDQHARRHQRATALGDQLENRLQIGLTAQRPCDLDRRVQRLVGLLKLATLSF